MILYNCLSCRCAKITMLGQLMLILCLPSVSSAAHIAVNKAVMNSSVHLDIRNHSTQQFDDLSWIHNDKDTVMKYYRDRDQIIVYPPFKDRVEFQNKSHGLLLKNLQKNDSGLYTARISGAQNTIVSKYMLYVLDPVTNPIITQQPSNDPCNVTFTCRGHDLSVSFGCYNYSCDESKETSDEDKTLSLHFQNKSIICNHSNAVSWKNGVIKMSLCSSEDETKQSAHPHIVWLWPVIGSLMAVVSLVVLGLAFFTLRKSRSKDEDKPNDTLPVQPSSSA
uniref:CD48 antigen-like isoform X2 n=1 Tax=Brachyhypopomus gauderio TaxID=698409 RepID=UPI004041C807